MTIGLILKRMRREWRSLSILLLAVCLLTGFFALGPFYIRAVTEVGLRYELDNAQPQELQVDLIVRDGPLTPEEFDVVREELDDLATGYRYYIRADYTAPTQDDDFGGLVTEGYRYQYGVPPIRLGRIRPALQPYAFQNMDELLTLVEGRWPERLPTPREVASTGDDELDELREVGNYTRGQVEMVVTLATVQRLEEEENIHLELGSRIVLARFDPDAIYSAVAVIVGIVEPTDPNALFWNGNRTFLEGSLVENELGVTRYDFGMATIPEAYVDWVARVTPGNRYIYTIDTDTSVINADNFQSVADRLDRLERRMQQYHPGFQRLTGLMSILRNYDTAVEDTEGPIIFLSGAILIMMLYHLINTVALVLEQQGTEWSTIVSRGGNVPQLIMLQVLTVGTLAVIGMLVGPLLSILFMAIMENFGPLSEALGDRSLGSLGIPRLSMYLSFGAALAAVIVLTGPAFPAARKSLLRLKQLVSRPPTRPAWARYALDLVLALIGISFMLRLYYLVGGNFGDLLNNLIAAPGDVIDLIADNLNQTGGLNDPFNLLAPALILTGAAMFWLRMFPWVMGWVSRFFDNSRRLTTPMAVWNVARDPSHYAQLVLLLIGTLALGTASLSLIETRDQGAWQTARAETGGSARIRTTPMVLQEPRSMAWDQMPGVESSVVFLHAEGDPGSAAPRNVHIIGLDPASVPAEFSVLAGVAAQLQQLELPPAPGMALPDDAAMLELQVYSLPTDTRDNPNVTVQNVSVMLVAYLEDALGVPYAVPLLQPQVAGDVRTEDDGTLTLLPTDTEQWVTFEGALPELGRAPFRLLRIGMNSRQTVLTEAGDQVTVGELPNFRHTVYIDRLVTRDVNERAELVEGFEDQANTWANATVADIYAPPWVSRQMNVFNVRGMDMQRVAVAEAGVPSSDGSEQALRLDYHYKNDTPEPSVAVNEPFMNVPADWNPQGSNLTPHRDNIPVVITQMFAETFTGQGTYRSATTEPLKPGDAKNLSPLEMSDGGSVSIDYEVVGVIDSLPSFNDNDLVLITHIDLLRPILNHQASSGSNFFFDENEIWLELPGREPSNALEEQVAGVDGVENVTWAWTRFGEIQREPLPSAVAGMMYAGFWISLVLSLLDFAFYLVVTARQRLFTFGVLRSLGWDASQIWRLLFVEQIVMITPALIIGSLIGAGLAYLLLPFLALVGGETLKLPWLSLLGLVLVLVVSFTVLMGVAAIFLRRMSVNQVLRLGEE